MDHGMVDLVIWCVFSGFYKEDSWDMLVFCVVWLGWLDFFGFCWDF